MRRRNAIVLVVGGDGIEDGVVLREAPALIFDDAVGRGRDLAGALAPVKGLKVFEGIALGRCA